MRRCFLSAVLAALLLVTGCAGKKGDLVLPVTENDTGKVLIQTVSGSPDYKYNSYLITSPGGETAVLDPTEMPPRSRVDLKPSAIVCTHNHFDHTDADFTDSYTCPKLLYTEGEIRTEDFRIYTVASSHDSDTIVDPATNYITVIEVGGLRIAHMGDIGQTALTDGQIAAIGKIDIAFMQFENSYSGMTLENGKGFSIIEQLNPAVIIPTHYTENALPALEEHYREIREYENVLEISRKDLPEGTLHVCRILNTHKYA